MSSNFGGRIRQLRKQRSMTQAQVAEKSGLNDRTIRRIEAGKGAAAPSTVRALASALDTDVHELTRLLADAEQPSDPPRLQGSPPLVVVPVHTGHDFVGALRNAHSYRLHTGDSHGLDEVREAIKSLLGSLEWVDMADEINPGDVYELADDLTHQICTLKAHGFTVAVLRQRGTFATAHGPIPDWVETTVFIDRLSADSAVAAASSSAQGVWSVN